MKQLTTFSGKNFFLEEDEAENVKRLWVDDSSEPIELRDGTMLNPKAIESISDSETWPYFGGNPMNKAMTKVFVGGEWKMFAGRRNQIEMRELVKVKNLELL